MQTLQLQLQWQWQLQLFNKTTRRLGDSPLCCRDRDRRGCGEAVAGLAADSPIMLPRSGSAKPGESAPPSPQPVSLWCDARGS